VFNHFRPNFSYEVPNFFVGAPKACYIFKEQENKRIREKNHFLIEKKKTRNKKESPII
jgi:hypothetical protein